MVKCDWGKLTKSQWIDEVVERNVKSSSITVFPHTHTVVLNKETVTVIVITEPDNIEPIMYYLMIEHEKRPSLKLVLS